MQPLKERLASSRRSMVVIYSVLAVILIWALFFFESKYDLQPDHFSRLPLILLALFQPAVLLLLFCAAWCWNQAQRDERLLRRICDAMAQGMGPPPSRGPSKAIVRNKIILVILVILLEVFIIINQFPVLNP